MYKFLVSDSNDRAVAVARRMCIFRFVCNMQTQARIFTRQRRRTRLGYTAQHVMAWRVSIQILNGLTPQKPPPKHGYDKLFFGHQ